MPTHLPFDVWVAVAAYLPVRSLLYLRSTSRAMKDIFGDHAIWKLAVDDIMGVVPPSSAVLYNIPRMSAEELRHQAVLASRMERLWRREFINPSNTRRHSLLHDSEVSNAEILPGGGWIVMQLATGHLHLYQLQTMEKLPIIPLAIFKPLDNIGPDEALPLYMSLLLTFSDGDHFAMTCDYHTDSNNLPTFRLFHINIATPEIRLISTFTRPDWKCQFAIDSNVLATGWREDETYLLSITRLHSIPDEPLHEVIMDLGPDIPDFASMTILCSDRMLLYIPTQFQLYAIPELHEDISRARYTPLAVCDLTPELPDWTPIWNNICPHHSENSRICGITNEDNLKALILPPKGRSGEHPDHIRYNIKLRHFISPSRIIWEHEDVFKMITFKSCTYFAAEDNHPGYMRLERSKAPNPSDVVSIPLLEVEKQLVDLSWDAASGRICAVLGSKNPSHWEGVSMAKTLLLIDLL